MTESIKFDPKKLAKLNNPERLKYLNPAFILQNFNIGESPTLIDIGAGTGLFAKAFSGLMNDGKIYACDTSEIMINWMQENIQDSKIIPVLNSENKIPLPDETADIVYMMNLHHELYEPDKVLAESYRLLKNNGKIAVLDWKKEETPDGPPVDIRVEEAKVIKCLESCGFNNIKSITGLSYHYFIIAEKLKIN